MRKSILGKIYLIVGIYLTFIFPILSLTLNKVVVIGFDVPLSPFLYWMVWLLKYGLYTIFLAVLGVYLIFRGYRYIKGYY